MSSPSNMITPSLLSMSRITMVEVVDLPQPDSPTKPTLSPRATAKLMPSTARNVSGSGAGRRAKIFPKGPPSRLRGYSLTSFSTMSSGAVPVPWLETGTDVAPSAPDPSSGSRSRSDTPGRGVARISLHV